MYKSTEIFIPVKVDAQLHLCPPLPAPTSPLLLADCPRPTVRPVTTAPAAFGRGRETAAETALGPHAVFAPAPRCTVGFFTQRRGRRHRCRALFVQHAEPFLSGDFIRTGT